MGSFSDLRNLPVNLKALKVAASACGINLDSMAEGE